MIPIKSGVLREFSSRGQTFLTPCPSRCLLQNTPPIKQSIAGKGSPRVSSNKAHILADISFTMAKIDASHHMTTNNTATSSEVGSTPSTNSTHRQRILAITIYTYPKNQVHPADFPYHHLDDLSVVYRKNSRKFLPHPAVAPAAVSPAPWTTVTPPCTTARSSSPPSLPCPSVPTARGKPRRCRGRATPAESLRA